METEEPLSVGWSPHYLHQKEHFFEWPPPSQIISFIVSDISSGFCFKAYYYIYMCVCVLFVYLFNAVFVHVFLTYSKSDILSGILSGICHISWHSGCAAEGPFHLEDPLKGNLVQSFWHSITNIPKFSLALYLTYVLKFYLELSRILSGILLDIPSGMCSCHCVPSCIQSSR
jgi:hypothetical protein